MIGRRSTLAAIAALGLAGCATNAPLLESDARAIYAVQNVTVNTNRMTGAAVRGRVNEYSHEKVSRDVRATLSQRLKADPRGIRNVDVSVELSRFSLVSPGQSFLIGGASQITGVVMVRDSKTGQVVLERATITGTAKGVYTPGGLAGAISTRSVEDDYRNTIAGFATDVERHLFGADSKAKPAVSTSASQASESDDLETRVRKARKQAELEARRRHDSTCINLKCQRDIEQSRKEAEQRVRREAALETN